MRRSRFSAPSLKWLSLALLPLLVHVPGSAAELRVSREERNKLNKETINAIDLLQSYHYKQKPFAEVDSKELLENYMKDLDYNKMYFLESDHAAILDRFGPTLKPTYLFVGDLYPAIEIFNTYAQRMEARIAWVQERLEGDFDFTGDDSFAPDRDKADWPGDVEAADALWEKRLKFELLSELVDDETLPRAKEKLSKRYDRLQRFLDEIEVHNVQETFLTSLAQLYDPHSNFFSWDSAQEFDIQISNSLVGIGAHLRDVDGVCVLERLLPGGPAEMSGQLHPGDKIVEVAQGDAEPIDVVGMKLRKVVQMIRGEEGTEVRLTIEPADSAKRKIVSLIREKVELTANLASADLYEVPMGTDRTVPIGVVRLPSFYGEGEWGEGNTSTSRDVEELISQLKDLGIEGLVLDLRNNGGGRLDEAVKLTGLFISKGPVVQKRSFNGKVEDDWDRDPAIAYTGPLVVLVSKTSASASEIVAGALQAHGRAVVLGDESTHGKGTVQAPIDLAQTMRRPWGAPPEVGTVKITVQKFYLPDGASTQNKGVTPDIVLPSVNEFLIDGEADLPNALEWDTIEPIAFTPPERGQAGFSFVTPQLMDFLASRNGQRQASLEEFTFLKSNIEWMREWNERETVSLNLEQRLQQEEENKNRREAFEKERDALAEDSFAVTKVDLGITRKKDAAHQEKLRATKLPDGRDRINQFYQKVFYHEDPKTGEIKEVWVEFFDYDRALSGAKDLAAVMTEASGITIDEAQMQEILTRFKNADHGAEFSSTQPFVDVMGSDVDVAAIENSLSAFYGKMVELDPDVLRERAQLDIPLRESLRVVADWLRFEEAPTTDAVAAKQDLKKETVPAN